MNKVLFIFIMMLINTYGFSQSQWSQPDNPIELGQIQWLRNYDQAIKHSKVSGLPLLILFQEVPGCSNCTTYGHKVLSHPFIVEIIETHFTPLAIFNNKGGHDKEILEKFGEPNWNNPVVRILNSEENDLVPRLNADFSNKGLATNICLAMNLSGQIIPQYFSNWLAELKGQNNLEEAYLSMYCFWTGEKEIAQLAGVLSTEAGYMHGKEVVKVGFNKHATNLKSIVTQARKVNCADQVYIQNASSNAIADKNIGKYRVDKDVKYYLSKSRFRTIPMTALQAAKVNAAIGESQDPKPLLSPRQLALMSEKSKGHNYINEDFTESWYKALGAFY